MAQPMDAMLLCIGSGCTVFGSNNGDFIRIYENVKIRKVNHAIWNAEETQRSMIAKRCFFDCRYPVRENILGVLSPFGIGQDDRSILAEQNAIYIAKIPVSFIDPYVFQAACPEESIVANCQDTFGDLDLYQRITSIKSTAFNSLQCFGQS